MNWRCAAASLLLTVPASAATVTFKTVDGVTIEADYQPADKGQSTAILVHGVAAGRGEWEGFAAALRRRGMGTLAVDLRWHGELSQRPDVVWAKGAEDILAAARFLKKRGVAEDQLVLIGASIGANLCSQAFTALPKTRALVLLSPGADYRGVRLSRFPAARALAASSPADAYAHATVEQLRQLLPGLTVFEAKSGHGAQMFADLDFVDALVAWLSKRPS